jgi:hypothetical protein
MGYKWRKGADFCRQNEKIVEEGDEKKGSGKV